MTANKYNGLPAPANRLAPSRALAPASRQTTPNPSAGKAIAVSKHKPPPKWPEAALQPEAAFPPASVLGGDSKRPDPLPKTTCPNTGNRKLGQVVLANGSGRLLS